jgi:hypothetical protein
MKRKIREPKNPNIAVWVFVAVFVSIPFLLVWGNTILNRNPPSPIPNPPEKIDKLVGIETGKGFWVIDPVIMSMNGNEFIYLDSLTSEHWEPINRIEELQNEKCEPKYVRLFEKYAGDIVVCTKAYSMGEWCPGPIGYYAQSSSDIIWQYKKERLCFFGALPIVLFAGIFLLIIGFIVRIVASYQNRAKENKLA